MNICKTHGSLATVKIFRALRQNNCLNICADGKILLSLHSILIKTTANVVKNSLSCKKEMYQKVTKLLNRVVGLFEVRNMVSCKS